MKKIANFPEFNFDLILIFHICKTNLNFVIYIMIILMVKGSDTP